MKKTIVIRGIHDHEAEKSNSIRNYIEEKDFIKIQKLLDHIKEPVFVNIAIDIHRPHPHHICDMRIHGPHFEIIIKKEGPELYKVIDEVFDETFNQLVKYKEKQIELRKTGDSYK